MSDRLTVTPQGKIEGIRLDGRGRLWGVLSEDCRYLEVCDRGRLVTFDLWETERQGRAVVAWWEEKR